MIVCPAHGRAALNREHTQRVRDSGGVFSLNPGIFCQYVAGDFSVDNRFFHNLTNTEREISATTAKAITSQLVTNRFPEVARAPAQP